MDENSKQNDIVTEILDEAFNKEWDTFSPEEYKHQLAETLAEVKKLTPDEEKTKMNRRMNLRVQATAHYRKDRHKSRATRKRYFQAFCYACDYLADTCNLQKVSNITPKHFRKVTEYWKSYKAPSTIQTELSGFRHYCKLAGCKHKMPENKELKLPKREPKKYNRGWLLTEYQKAREIAEFMNRFDVRDGLDLGWHLGLRIIEACQLKVKDVRSALNVNGPDIKGKGGQVRFVKIETKEQLELLNRLYREAKAKGLTDDDFIISKTIRYGPRLEKKSIENWIYNHRKEFTDQDRKKKVNPGKKPRIDKLVFHGLRHSYNQNREKWLDGNPKKLQKLSQGLGHRRLAVNDIYRE